MLWRWYDYSMHRWQDYVLAVTAFGFSVALIPTIRSKNKPPILTSLGSSVFLVAVLIAYGSLSLWYSVFMVGLNLSMWLIIALQKYSLTSTSKSKRARR